jgi:hypothetical protein
VGVIEIGRVTMGVSEKERERERETHLESETPPRPKVVKLVASRVLSFASIDTFQLIG